MIQTALTRLLQIEHPIMQAGMASNCGARLAAAVSNAGALGAIGSIGRSPGNFAEEIRRCHAETTRPFAANIVTFDWAPFAEQMVDVAIQERAPVITLSFGDPLPALAKCQAAGIPAVIQVQDLAAARAAIAARATVIAVQGNEAGGHTGRRGTLSFSAQVLDIADGIPVVIAGGIANGRGLAAALAMGAAGVLMGTRFKATPEFGPALLEDVQKSQIVASDGSNTVYDEVNDIAIGLAWPNNITGRTLSNDFHDHWLGRQAELREAVAAEQEGQFAVKHTSEPNTLLNWAGESAGLIDEVLPAATVVERTVAEAEQWLRAVASTMTDPR